MEFDVYSFAYDDWQNHLKVILYIAFIISYTFLYELGIYMALVQLIVEVEEDFKETLKDLAKQEDRTLKAFVTRALKREAAIAKSGNGVAA